MFRSLDRGEGAALHPNPYGSILNKDVLPIFLNPRFRSVVRGNLLVLLSLTAAFFLSDFPHNRQTVLLAIPTVVALIGTADTIRCMRPRWSFYHGGVLLCIYMDLMALAMILFFFLYPYTFWVSSAH